jgi:diacylglycerol kinase family enzyme
LIAHKGTLFINPSSGARRPPGEREAIRAEAAASGLEVVDIAPGLDLTELIRQQMDRGRRLFVAAGGDGTINHVVQPLVQHPEAVFGVVPIGTYNHFARDLGIPLDWREALEVIANGDMKQIDAGRINQRFFVNNVSLGAYPELVARREERGRDYPRWKARLYAFRTTLRALPRVAFAVETANHREAIRTNLFMLSNNSYDLSRIGIEASRTTLESGRLSVYWLPELPRWELMRFVAHYLTGNVRTAPGFRSFRTSQMKIYSPKKEIRVAIDGEVFGIAPPLVITIVPRSLTVRVPRAEQIDTITGNRRSSRSERKWIIDN